MLYALLIIIAIGVLLASEEGKKLLGFIIMLLAIGSLLFLGFWVVIFVVSLLSDTGIKDSISNVFEEIIFISFAIYVVYKVYKKYKRGELTKEIIKTKFKVVWMENWKHHKGFTIFMLILFSLFPVVIIWSLILNQ